MELIVGRLQRFIKYGRTSLQVAAGYFYYLNLKGLSEGYL